MLFRNKYNKEFESGSIDYINLIIDKIEENLIVSSTINNGETFSELLLFLRDDLILQSLNKSISVYNRLILIPSNIYPKLSYEDKKKLIEYFTIRFAENITIINHSNKSADRYLEVSYYGFISLIKKIIDERNHENFNLLISSLKETMFSLDDENFDYYSLTFCYTILFWLFYLYQNNEINLNDYDIKIFENQFLNTYHNREELLNYFYKFRKIKLCQLCFNKLTN